MLERVACLRWLAHLQQGASELLADHVGFSIGMPQVGPRERALECLGRARRVGLLGANSADHEQSPSGPSGLFRETRGRPRRFVQQVETGKGLLESNQGLDVVLVDPEGLPPAKHSAFFLTHPHERLTDQEVILGRHLLVTKTLTNRHGWLVTPLAKERSREQAQGFGVVVRVLQPLTRTGFSGRPVAGVVGGDRGREWALRYAGAPPEG